MLHDGQGEGRLHANGQPGDGRTRVPTRRRGDPCRSNRRCPRGPRLDEPAVQVLEAAPDIVARPRETPGIPNHVHWYEFLGPAPDRPYHPVYHPHNWRGWWDFGTGSLGDMACHTANLAFMALKLGLPTSVWRSGEINSETYPAWAIDHL